MSRPISRAEYLALVRVARERRRYSARRDLFMLEFLAGTGLRISEALALSVADFRPEEESPFLLVRTLKRRKPIREAVFLDRKTLAAFRRWLRELPAFLGRPPGPLDPVLPTWNVPRLSAPYPAFRLCRRAASKVFAYYATKAALADGVSLHSLRHYRGSVLYSQTRDLEFTRSQLRHSTIRATGRYVHTDPETIRQYLHKLGS